MRHRIHFLSVFCIMLAVTPSAISQMPIPAEQLAAGRLDVRLEPGTPPRASQSLFHSSSDVMTAQVNMTFNLRNDTDQPDVTQRHLPVLASPYLRNGWCQVFVDGQPVEVRVESLLTSPNAESPFPGGPPEEWNRRVNTWIQQDERLFDMVSRFRKLCGDRDERMQWFDAIGVEIKKHLIDENVVLAVRDVLQGDDHFRDLVAFIVEVDPMLRIDEPFQRWKYVSLIGSSDPLAFLPYEDEWRRKVDAWVADRPRLKQLADQLRSRMTSFKKGQHLLNETIVKYVHDQRGLDLKSSVAFRDFLQHGPARLSEHLVRSLFPDVAQSLDHQKAADAAILAKWGFDQSVISPFTGKRLPDASDQVSFDWRDSTVGEILNRPSRPPVSFRNRPSKRVVPSLLTFTAPLPAKATTTVKIEYRVPVSLMAHPAFSVPTGLDELAVVFPAAKNTTATVTVPARTYAVVAPAPQSIKSQDDGRMQFETVLTANANTLHIKPIQFAGGDNAYMRRLGYRDPKTADDLLYVADRIDNMSAKSLLLSSRYLYLLREDPWAANQLERQIEKQHPEFMACFELLTHSEQYAADTAREMYKWCQQKIASPVIETKDDFHRFSPNSSNDTYTLTVSSLQRLSKELQDAEIDGLTAREQMGRLFILCQAGVEPKKNLGAMLELASPEDEVYMLRLIQHLKCEKVAALPRVLSSLDADIRSRRLGGDSPIRQRWHAAYEALRTFNSTESGLPIIKFITTTEDASLIQAAIEAISKLTLPERFDDLTSIADRVSKSSESAFIQYVDLLVRSDKARAIPLLVEFRDRYPRFRPRIMRALAKANYRLALQDAIKIYQDEAASKEELQAAVEVLRDLAGPDEIASLKYRRGLESWMNERLVFAIRLRGGNSSAFPFVESFYLEHVKGKNKHNQLTCVDAFVQIGDERAIPYLREIFRHTERKRDAAEAIGRIMHPKRRRRPQFDNPLDLAINTIGRANATPSETEEAWKLLLLDQNQSVSRMLAYGRLRNVIQDARPSEAQIQSDDFLYLRRFGDVAAEALLAASDGCSLERRYTLAQLLRVLLPESLAVIREAANDQTVDFDRRQTARLALESQ